MGAIQLWQEANGWMQPNTTVEISWFYDGVWIGDEQFVVLDSGQSGWGLQISGWNGCVPRQP
jgi:hypothetical protein